ncbi:MAG TPA: cupin domain-containing protein [Polyangia bacterium]|jgi:hypothetical protein
MAGDPARVLRFYRVVVALLLLGGAAGVWLARARPWRRPPAVEVRDLDAELATLAGRAATLADAAETYYVTPRASVHLHVMGFGQRCPLHLHPRTAEAAVIVRGAADGVQVSGEGGALRRRAGRYAEGALIASPPGCGHELVNAAPDALLASLVFAVPPFDGNHYVAADDPRMLAATAPSVYDPRPALAELAASSRLVELPAAAGRLAGLLVRTEAELPPERPLVAYVVEGEGALEAAGRHGLRPHHLVILRAGAPARVRATRPLALLLFRPEPAP